MKTHKKLVDYVNERLNSNTGKYGLGFYHIINYEQEFLCGGKTLMEVDNYAIRIGKRKNYLLLFEDKSSDKNRDKAMSQLERECENYDHILDRHHVPASSPIKVFKFYVHDYKKPVIEWVNEQSLLRDKMLNDLKHIKYLKDDAPASIYLKTSVEFQNNFLDNLKKLRKNDAFKVLYSFEDVYLR